MLAVKPKKDQQEEFNSYLNQKFGEIRIFNRIFPASEILEEIDESTYDEEYEKFVDSEE